MNGKIPIVTSIAIVLAAVGFMIFTGLGDNMVYYYHVDEFYSKADSLGGEMIKVNGKVVDGSIKKQQLDYNFVIQGSKENQIQVSYHGVVPDTFKDSADVVVEGAYDPGTKVFTADTLMAKCPTKYEPEQQANIAE